jgi:hypothetical protein
VVPFSVVNVMAGYCSLHSASVLSMCAAYGHMISIASDATGCTVHPKEDPQWKDYAQTTHLTVLHMHSITIKFF